MKNFLELINIKKIELYSNLPICYRKWKYAEYLVHVICGTVIYALFVLANLVLQFNEFMPLIAVSIIAFVVEAISELRVRGTGNVYDFIATIIIPVIIFLL